MRKHYNHRLLLAPLSQYVNGKAPPTENGAAPPSSMEDDQHTIVCLQRSTSGSVSELDDMLGQLDGAIDLDDLFGPEPVVAAAAPALSALNEPADLGLREPLGPGQPPASPDPEELTEETSDTESEMDINTEQFTAEELSILRELDAVSVPEMDIDTALREFDAMVSEMDTVELPPREIADITVGEAEPDDPEEAVKMTIRQLKRFKFAKAVSGASYDYLGGGGNVNFTLASGHFAEALRRSRINLGTVTQRSERGKEEVMGFKPLIPKPHSQRPTKQRLATILGADDIGGTGTKRQPLIWTHNTLAITPFARARNEPPNLPFSTVGELIGLNGVVTTLLPFSFFEAVQEDVSSWTPPLSVQGSVSPAPTQEPRWTINFQNSGPSTFAFDIAKDLAHNQGNTMYRRMMDVALTHYYGNGNFDSVLRRLRAMEEMNQIAHKKLPKGSTHDSAFTHCYPKNKWDKRWDAKLKTQIINDKERVRLMRAGYAIPQLADGIGQQVEITVEASGAKANAYVPIWALTDPSQLSAAMQAKGLPKVYSVNKHSRCGIIYPQSFNRKEIIITDPLIAQRLVEAEDKNLDTDEKFCFMTGKLTPKTEVQSEETLSTKGVRIYSITDSAAQAPIAVVQNAVYHNALIQTQLPKEEILDTISMYGVKMYGPELGQWIHNIREILEDTSNKIRCIFAVFSDNAYSFYIEDDKTITFASLDGAKMEASHTPRSVECHNVRTLQDGFGVKGQFGGSGGLGKQSVKGEAIVTYPRIVDDKIINHEAKVTENGVSTDLLSYYQINATKLMCNIPVVLESVSMYSKGVSSGVQGTGYVNNNHMASWGQSFVEVTKRQENTVVVKPDKEMFLNPSEYPDHFLGPYYDTEGAVLSNPCATAAFAVAGLRVKPEHVVPDFFGALHSQQTVVSDLLGNDLREITIGNSKFIIPLLNFDRLLKAITYDKFKSAGMARHLDTVVKYRVLYLMGGFIYPEVSELLLNGIEIQINRINDFLQNSGYDITSVEDALVRSFEHIGQAVGEDIDEFFDNSINSFMSYSQGIMVPSLSEVFSVLAGPEAAEAATVAAIASKDPSVMIGTVPPDILYELLKTDEMPSDPSLTTFKQSYEKTQRIRERIKMSNEEITDIQEAVNVTLKASLPSELQKPKAKKRLYKSEFEAPKPERTEKVPVAPIEPHRSEAAVEEFKSQREQQRIQKEAAELEEKLKEETLDWASETTPYEQSQEVVGKLITEGVRLPNGSLEPRKFLDSFALLVSTKTGQRRLDRKEMHEMLTPHLRLGFTANVRGTDYAVSSEKKGGLKFKEL